MGTEAAEKWLSFEDYLTHANSTDYHYELIDGELVPVPHKVSVLVLVEGLYEDRTFKGEERIVSGIFEKLAVTADQVLGAGKQ